MENNNQPQINNQPSGAHSDQPVSPDQLGGPFVSGNQQYPASQDLSPKKSPKKLLWVGIFVALLIVAGGIALWAHASKTHKTTTKKTTVVTAPKVPAPLVTTSAPATLKPGTYTVGPDKNIVPGLYSLAPGTQQSGGFTIISAAANYSVTLDDNSTGAVGDAKLAWAQLVAGDKVQISGGNLQAVTFRAVVMTASTQPALAKLYDDTFTVSDTPHQTNPGRYFITDTNDKNAYILIIDKNYNIKYNEPLNSTGFHAVLADGDQIATINLTSYLMKPE